MAEQTTISVRAAATGATADESGDAGADPAEPDRPPSPEVPLLFNVQIDPGAQASGDVIALLQQRGAEAAIETLRAAGAAANPDAPHDVRVLIVADERMASMHQQYKNIPGTTDVLTFDARPESADPIREPLDVDIVVCVDEAARQARERGHDAGRELLLYVVHALLHCLGHDDADKQSSERMHAREDEILAAMGLGAVYAAPQRTDAGAPDSRGAAEPTC